MNAQTVFGLFKQTFTEWNEDKAPRLAAALAYYTVFSLAPLLVIVIAIAGLVFGQEAAQGQLDEQLRGFLGDGGADAIQQMIAGASKPSSGIIATVTGIATLLFGASGLFGQLQDALNTIWGVAPKPDQGILATLKQRFFSFSMVLGTGFLLLVSLVVSTVLGALGASFQSLLPGSEAVWGVVNFIVSFAIITLLFAAIFKVIPDADVAWQDVWIGAAFTALLFSLGRFLIAQFLTGSANESTYGAAASLVLLLIWVYYSAQILFFGAEFTQVYANSYGSKVKPADNAVPVTEEMRAEQGIPHKEYVAAIAEQEERGNGAASNGSVKANGTSSNDRTKAVVTQPTTEPPPKSTSALIGFFAGLLVGMRRGRSSK